MKNEALIPAATVMMLRDTADGPEVFMVVRHHEIDFASDSFVCLNHFTTLFLQPQKIP